MQEKSDVHGMEQNMIQFSLWRLSCFKNELKTCEKFENGKWSDKKKN